MERASLPSSPAVTPAAPADRAATNANAAPTKPKRARATPKTDQVCSSHGPCRPRKATQPHGHHAHPIPSTSPADCGLTYHRI
eukprot:scaffold46555_cov33-Tisochrysis_lutea.AAC.1